MKQLLILILLASCTKDKTDYSYWNTDRRPQVILVSQRYTDPPTWLNKKEWKVDSLVLDSLPRDVDYRSYEGLIPDTNRSTCPVYGNNLYIEISWYKIYRR